MVSGERRAELGADKFCSTSIYNFIVVEIRMQALPSQPLNTQHSTMKLQKPIRVAFLGKSASRGGSQRELSCIVKYLDKEPL